MRPNRRVPRAGERVKTRFGPAKVLQVFGGDAMVQIGGGLKVRVSLGDVELGASAAPPKLTSPGPRSAASVAVPAERHLVDALRFGVVPRRGIERLTVGFEDLQRYVSGRLPSGSHPRPTYTEIRGPFGAGKSHTMAVVRHVASARRFLVAHVEIDGKAVTLSDPDGLLMQIMKTLRLPDGEHPAPALELHRACARKLSREESRDALGAFDRAWSNLETVRAAERHEVLDDFAEELDAVVAGSNEVQPTDLKRRIERHLNSRGIYTWGNDVHVGPKRLVGRTVVERGPDFTSCLLGYAKMARLAGFGGLAVTIDELEVEWALLSRLQLVRLAGLLLALQEAFTGEDGRGCPLALFTANVPSGQSAARTVLDLLKEGTHGARYELTSWAEDALGLVSQRVCEMYAQAYGIEVADPPQVSSAVRAHLTSQDLHDASQVRPVIRAVVGELDRRHGPPSGH